MLNCFKHLFLLLVFVLFSRCQGQVIPKCQAASLSLHSACALSTCPGKGLGSRKELVLSIQTGLVSLLL